jgi:hypothetical protein
MVKISALIIFWVLTASCSVTYHGPNQEVVDKFEVFDGQLLLVVRPTKVDYTDYSTATCSTDDCIIMRTWFVYEANVLDVLSGEFNEQEIAFANMQHSYYIDEYTQNWYVLLREFDEQSTIDKLRVRYYAIQHESTFNGN